MIRNNLPYELRTLTNVFIFKNKLKTYLFEVIFRDIDAY
jgi:hypothetical protein